LRSRQAFPIQYLFGLIEKKRRIGPDQAALFVRRSQLEKIRPKGRRNLFSNLSKDGSARLVVSPPSGENGMVWSQVVNSAGAGGGADAGEDGASFAAHRQVEEPMGEDL
jgi:hypothetical protein